jgi:hypothetical protein
MFFDSNPNAKSPDVPGVVDIAPGSAVVSTCLGMCGEQIGLWDIMAGPCRRHCEPTGRREAPPDDRLREAIHFATKKEWIASSLALLGRN